MTLRPLHRLWARLLVLGVLVLLSSCRTLPPPAEKPKPVVTAGQEPVVRVRIGTSVTQVQVHANGPVSVMAGPPDSPQSTATALMPPVIVRRDAIGFSAQSQANGQILRWRTDSVTVAPPAGQLMRVNGTVYPGKLAAAINPQAGGGVAFDLVNHVGIESYLPGVIEHELYQSWHPQTFATQAVAARSYALYRLSRTPVGRHYDVEATVADQMYGGSSAHATAVQAVRDTRGVVLSYRGQILPAYYSSNNGGVGQDVRVVFPKQPDLAPLRGLPVDNWGATGQNFYWGPIRRDVGEVSARIAAWGRSKGHPVAGLRTLARVRISAVNAGGRPTAFALTDTAGRSYTLGAEEFRFACNQTAAGLGEAPAGTKLKSSFVQVAVEGRTVLFTGGRGSGHGVGMSQWGAQAMAVKGYKFNQILAYYYPGADLKRLY
ncbi:MAG: SpoIID/LytB domain-containing protein [Phycisphaeraceae bacterium]|nr:SpoIID/LytB domain-containing protein [Phycisphaeraceae bacterium]